jgi:hypothetical protein
MSVLPIEGVPYVYDEAESAWKARGREPLPVTPPVVGLRYDWTEDNAPWAYATGTAPWEADLPSGIPVVNLSSTGATFWDRLNNTQAAQPGRHIIRLPDGVHQLTSFRMIGSSGDPNYAFGFWFPKLAGLIGNGADRCFVQMNANSMSTAQLNQLATLTRAAFAPSQIGFCRIDGTPTSPCYLGGITFRAADQQMLTSKGSDINMYVPQPAPHRGVFLYADGPLSGVTSYCRFQGAARAAMSQPPFEHGNLEHGRGYVRHNHVEFDGRRSPALDPARPRRCGVFMLNSEYDSMLQDCWLHHSNVSRYAANDQNNSLNGVYALERCKVEQITNNENRDPALNGGNSLGEFTNASLLGWESSAATIRVTDCIVSQDNNKSAGQVPMHYQLTWVGNRNPQGGRMYVRGTLPINTGWPQLDGFHGFRIKPDTYWWTDGFNNTLFVYHHETEARLQPYVVTGTWPPTAAQLAAANVRTTTHYLIRSA